MQLRDLSTNVGDVTSFNEMTPYLYPLSPLQQGMLFHYLEQSHAGVDIEQIVVHLPERICVNKLEEAWQWLARRHELLRTRFVWDVAGEPQQEVLPAVAVSFAVQDCRCTVSAARHGLLHEFLELDRVRGFDLNQAPLFRLRLFVWEDASYSLVWTFHHALIDGRCYVTLLREVFETYAELCVGAIRERSAPPAYRRYIDWLRGRSLDQADEFWKQSLAGFTAPTPLVVDRRSVDIGVSELHGEIWESLDPATTAALRAVLEPRDLNLNSLVMAAWAILLHMYSGEEDIVFGGTRACRKSSVVEADSIVGPFINTVPVRVSVCDENSFEAIVRSVRRVWLAIRPFEHTPLTRVKAVSQLQPGAPLFETLVVFENQRLSTAMQSLGGAWSTRSVEIHELTNFPVTLAAYDGKALSFKIEFHRDRFDDQTIRAMLGHLRNLLEEFAKHPDAIVRDLAIVSAADALQLIETFNSPFDATISGLLPLDGAGTLHQLFEAQAARRPEAIALTFGEQSLTYRELNAQANRLARQLVQHGVQADTLVGLCVDRSNELVIALLAILKAGGAYLPIDLAYPAERLAFMLEDAQAPVLLTQTSLAGNLPPHAPR